MRLAAMMGLVVEEMAERRRKSLRDGAHVDGHVGETSGKRLVAHTTHPVDNPPVLSLTRQSQGRQGAVENGGGVGRRIALTREALHPDAIDSKQMVERPKHRAEDGADVTTELLLAKIGGGIVEASVGPLIVSRKHHEMLLHSSHPAHRESRLYETRSNGPANDNSALRPRRPRCRPPVQPALLEDQDGIGA